MKLKPAMQDRTIWGLVCFSPGGPSSLVPGLPQTRGLLWTTPAGSQFDPVLPLPAVCLDPKSSDEMSSKALAAPAVFTSL